MKIVSNRITSYSNGHLLTLKNHRLVEVIWDIDNDVSTTERESFSPVWLELMHTMYARSRLWLAAMSKIAILLSLLIIGIAIERRETARGNVGLTTGTAAQGGTTSRQETARGNNSLTTGTAAVRR